MDKKGQVVSGLDVVIGAMILLLVAGIVAFSVIVTLGAMETTDLGDLTVSVDFNAQTTTAMNTTGWQITDTVNLKSCLATLSTVTNSTGSNVNSGNYTISSCFVNASTATVSNLNDNWVLNGSYTYSSQLGLAVTQNVSAGTASFFSNTTIWFSLLAIIIIILIVVLIVVAVQRLQGRGTTSI